MCMAIVANFAGHVLVRVELGVVFLHCKLEAVTANWRLTLDGGKVALKPNDRYLLAVYDSKLSWSMKQS